MRKQIKAFFGHIQVRDKNGRDPRLLVIAGLIALTMLAKVFLG